MNPFLDPRAKSRRQHLVEPHYLRRCARIGSVLLAIGMLGAIVWHAHEQANPPDRRTFVPPEFPEEADRSVETVETWDDGTRPDGVNEELRASVTQPPVLDVERGERILVDVSATGRLPLPPLEVVTDVNANSDAMYHASSKSVVLEYSSGTEVFGFSSKFGAIRPFETADDPAGEDDKDDEEETEDAPPQADEATAEP